ncbi:hypothetical protein CRUP_013314 [Coryphaenoides rupestris]|nr:hypothetical protein CRUP_013314 [Coryphaenoides rupestris]
MASGSSSRSSSFKVVLLGEGCVGKTSLVLRYCENKFNDKHITTLQDTAGQERFHALGPIYYRDSNGAILVYDIDLDKDRHVAVDEAECYADSVGARHYHTSAKLNKGIEELFLDLCKRMMETAQAEERLKGGGAGQSGASRRGLQIVDDEPQAATTGGCCSG